MGGRRPRQRKTKWQGAFGALRQGLGRIYQGTKKGKTLGRERSKNPGGKSRSINTKKIEKPQEGAPTDGKKKKRDLGKGPPLTTGIRTKQHLKHKNLGRKKFHKMRGEKGGSKSPNVSKTKNRGGKRNAEKMEAVGPGGGWKW